MKFLISILILSFLILVTMLLLRGFRCKKWRDITRLESYQRLDRQLEIFLLKMKRKLYNYFIFLLNSVKIFLSQIFIIGLRLKRIIFSLIGGVGDSVAKLDIKDDKGSVSIYLQDVSDYKKEEDKS